MTKPSAWFRGTYHPAQVRVDAAIICSYREVKSRCRFVSFDPGDHWAVAAGLADYSPSDAELERHRIECQAAMQAGVEKYLMRGTV